MLPDCPLLLISQRSPDLAHVQCQDSAHSHQCHLAAPQVNMDELCLHHLRAPFHERSGMGAKNTHNKTKWRWENLPLFSALYHLFFSPLKNKLSPTDSISFFLPPSDSNCKAGIGEDTSICSSLSLEWKCLLLFGQLWETPCWTRPHVAGEKQRSWQESKKKIYVESVKLCISVPYCKQHVYKRKKFSDIDK